MIFSFISPHPTPSHSVISRVRRALRVCKANPQAGNLHPLFSPSITKSTDLRVAGAPLHYCPSSACLRMCESCLLLLTSSQCQLSLFSRFSKIKDSYVFTWGWSRDPSPALIWSQQASGHYGSAGLPGAMPAALDGVAGSSCIQVFPKGVIGASSESFECSGIFYTKGAAKHTAKIDLPVLQCLQC